MPERHKTNGVLRTMSKRRKALCLSILLPLLAASSSIDCPVQNLVYPVYSLQRADGTADTLTVDTLWVWTQRADGTDTLLLNRLCGSAATTFNLPISYSNPEDQLVFMLRDTLGNQYIDTVRIKKDSYPHFESVDCQAAFFHRLTDVSTTHRAIDSIAIHHSSVNYDTQNAHFYIYFAPRY